MVTLTYMRSYSLLRAIWSDEDLLRWYQFDWDHWEDIQCDHYFADIHLYGADYSYRDAAIYGGVNGGSRI